MSRFYAEIQGNGGSATRMGTKDSGIKGHIRGWHLGARVDVDNVDGEDVVEIQATGGSAGYWSRRLLTLRLLPNGKLSVTLHKPNGKPSVTYRVPVR